MDLKGKVLKVKGAQGRVLSFFVFKGSAGQLGGGSFGKVFLARRLDGLETEETCKSLLLQKERLFAVKEIKRRGDSREERELFERETEHMAEVTLLPDVTNVVRVFPYQLDSPRHYYIVMEFCEGGTLAHLLACLRQREELARQGRGLFTRREPVVELGTVLHLFVGLMKGYAFLKRRNVVHEDIKPDNILFKRGEPMLTDFGFTINVRRQPHCPRGGTLDYNAPEKYNPAVLPDNLADVYALGVVFFQVIYGCHPYMGPAFQQQAKALFEAYARANPEVFLSREEAERVGLRCALKALFEQPMARAESRVRVPAGLEAVFESLGSLVRRMCAFRVRDRVTVEDIEQEMRLKNFAAYATKDELARLLVPRDVSALLDGAVSASEESHVALRPVSTLEDNQAVQGSFSALACSHVKAICDHLLSVNREMRLLGSLLALMEEGEAKSQGYRRMSSAIQQHVDWTYARLKDPDVAKSEYYDKGVDRLLTILLAMKEEVAQELTTQELTAQELTARVAHRGTSAGVEEVLAESLQGVLLSSANRTETILQALVYKLIASQKGLAWQDRPAVDAVVGAVEQLFDRIDSLANREVEQLVCGLGFVFFEEHEGE